MITRDSVIAQIVAYLNGRLSDGDLVAWAEDAVLALSESNLDVAGEDAVMPVLMYIAAGDQPGFPLSWSKLCGLLRQLGVRVKVVAEAV